MALKRRMILALTVSDGKLVRSKHFRADRTYSLDFVDLEGADELVVLDITPEPDATSTTRFIEVVERLSGDLFLPLAVGGHVRTWDYARELMNAGADKIVVGHHALNDVMFIERLVGKLGSSSVVAGVEAHPPERRPPNYDGLSFSMCGEILSQTFSRDGSLQGYDVDFIRELAALFNKPIIAMSGCGVPGHMIDAFNAGASACATSNIFHFTRKHVAMFKRKIAEAGIPMRPMVEDHFGPPRACR